jgi:hypothetical protein
MLATVPSASGKVSQIARWLAFDFRTLLVLAVLATVFFWLLNASLPVMRRPKQPRAHELASKRLLLVLPAYRVLFLGPRISSVRQLAVYIIGSCLPLLSIAGPEAFRRRGADPRLPLYMDQ